MTPQEQDRLKAARRAQELARYEGEDRVVSSHELFEVLHEKRKTIIPIHCNRSFPRLDGLINGFAAGELTVISGPTCNGKTLFAQSLTEAFAGQKIPGLWFTYEVPSYQFLTQFGDILPTFFMPREIEGAKYDWIESRVIEAKLKCDIQYVMIDHLHFLVDMRSKNNMSLEIGHVMRGLKRMALVHDLIIFLIAHTGKVYGAVELDNDSIRDSSFVAQESDNVFLIWRDTENEGQSTLKVSKNRREGVYGKKVYLIKVGKFLRELRDQDTPAEKESNIKEKERKAQNGWDQDEEPF